MANIVVRSKTKISLGLAGGATQLKVGKNEIDEKVYESVKDKWFFQALVKSGTVVVEVPAKPPRPSFPLAEIAIGPETLEFIPAEHVESITPEFPIRYVSPETISTTIPEKIPGLLPPAPSEATQVVIPEKPPVKAAKPVTSKMTKAEAPKKGKFRGSGK